MSAPNAPWDGRWTVPKPDDYTPGLYRCHQIHAHELLRSGEPWTEWEATFLQVAAYKVRGLSRLQWHWLNKLAARAERRAA